MPDQNFAILAQSGTCLQQSAADIGQAIRRARQVLPAGEKIVGAIQSDCVILPDPQAGPFRVMISRNQEPPAPGADAGQTGGKPGGK